MSVPEPAPTPAPPRRSAELDEMPAWVWPFTRRTITVAIVSVLATLILLRLIDELSGLVSWLLVAAFLSLAIEPAVNWLAAHGWRRGLATGLILLGVALLIVVLVSAMIPPILTQIRGVIDDLPRWIESLDSLTQRWFDVELKSEELQRQLGDLDASIGRYAVDVAGNVLGIGAAALGAIFQALTIGLFTFFIVANGPRIRRGVCSLLPAERQREVLRIWEIAIDKTGGYFYSRLLLAAISGLISYVVFRFAGVPFAALMALWMGVISQFIPIVGTYIAAAFPLLIALTNSIWSAVAVLVFVLVYQQVENYVVSPRITARTMELHPAVALLAAIAGASLGGVVWAFLALPVAATLQASLGTYLKRHEVLDDELTRDAVRAGKTAAADG